MVLCLSAAEAMTHPHHHHDDQQTAHVARTRQAAEWISTREDGTRQFLSVPRGTNFHLVLVLFVSLH